MEIIEKGDKVAILYKGYLEDGTVFDASKEEEPLIFTLGKGELIPGLEKEIEGLYEQEIKSNIKVLPEDAYGEYQQDLVAEFPMQALGENPDKLSQGSDIVLKSEEGQPIPAKIVEMKQDSFVVDANHFLAGETLYFDVEVLEVTKA